MDLIVRNARLRGWETLQDVAVGGGKVVEIGAVQGRARHEIDVEGRLLTASFVNPHVHLDKALLAERMRPNRSGTLEEAVEITHEFKRHYTIADVKARAARVLEMAVATGTTLVRGFADVDGIGGLTGLQALLELKREYADLVDLQVVAFPQEGLIRHPDARDLLGEALELGADVLGGFPWFEYLDDQARAHIDAIFELARRHDRPIHMLVDDAPEDPTTRNLEYLALRTIAEGWQGRVCASHACALSSYNDYHARRVITLVRQAGISVVTNPHISLILKNRGDHQPIPRGITRVKELLAAGVNVVFGQDDVLDPFYPFGRADMLEVASFTAHAAHLSLPEEIERVWDMATEHAAHALGVADHRLGVGLPANLVVVDAPTVVEALRRQGPRRLVIRSGRVVFESRTESRLIRAANPEPATGRAAREAR
ncbi:MAG: amidohydrolase family protein [Candidatus Rokubacteria bacterium]|nr:amidohydrolase family protein [Candidatus Rokubacteria bacterium]